jgi:hypothetical protein
MRTWVLVASFVFGIVCSAFGQQTVFNVPSGDVLERGKAYGEVDFTYKHSDGSTGYTPRIVVGVGHRIEVGLNVNGIGSPADLQTTLTPTIKWKAYDGGNNGWAFLAGDDLLFPVQNRTYDAGNYVWGEFTKTWRGQTRVTLGAYEFTPKVVASGHRAGGQFAIEQPVAKRVTLAADWYTGDHSLGYVTPGIIVKLNSKLTWYGSYQIGNRGGLDGNHQFLAELGWNFN